MSGAGFLFFTASPAKMRNAAACCGPTACSRTARTEASAEVDAMASVQPAACASAMIRAIPGRAGMSPSATKRV